MAQARTPCLTRTPLPPYLFAAPLGCRDHHPSDDRGDYPRLCDGGRRFARYAKNAQANIWQAAAVGNTDAITFHLAGGTEIDALDPVFGVAPLSWATLNGQLEAAEWLIGKGADVNAINKDGGTALHGAAFFGRTDIVNLLIDNGADINTRNHEGRRPFDDTQVDLETTRFVAELLAIEIDEKAVVQGRAESADLLRPSDAQTAKAAAPQPKRDEGEAFSFHHLWFLWHLCWLVVGFTLIALLTRRFPLPKLPDWLVLSPARYLWLIPLNAARLTVREILAYE